MRTLSGAGAAASGSVTRAVLWPGGPVSLVQWYGIQLGINYTRSHTHTHTYTHMKVMMVFMCVCLLIGGKGEPGGCNELERGRSRELRK
jgi:hypothetical protein